MSEQTKNVLPEFCADCGAGTPLYLHGQCHPHSRTWAVLHANNILVIECAECGKEIARFEAMRLLPLSH